MNFEWMLGLACTRVAAHTEHSAVFEFEDVSLMVESLWRISLGGRLALTATDHGQLFGLQRPVNAHEKAMEYLRGQRIRRVRVDEIRGDVTLWLSGRILLEVLTDSSGYEAWTLRGPHHHFVAASGGKVENLTG